jgi:Recombination, repair and ssDNA binding protein UvsY
MKAPVNIDDLMKEWSSDSYIDSTSMEKETLKISYLHSKYLNIMSYHRHVIRKLEADYKIKKGLKEDYYAGRLSQEELEEYGWEPCQFVLSDPKVARKIETDKELINMLLKKVAHEEIVSYCEMVLKSLHNRTWDLGNYVKYQQLTLGK